MAVRIHYRRCPLCKRLPVSGLFGIDGYWYCPHCSLAWRKIFPKSLYGENYYTAKSSLFSRLFSPIGNFFYLLRSTYIKQKQIHLWVDVGAGDGEFLRTVRAKRRIGVEISQSGRHIMEKYNLETMSEKQFLLSRNLKADVVSFWHVLEHIEDPWEYLPAASKNLRRGGVVVIGVPNGNSIELRLFQKHWFHLVPQHHLWFFSPKSIQRMLTRSGFGIAHIDFWSPEHHLTGILQSFINKTSGSDSVLQRLVKRRENFLSLSFADILSCIFWLTVGFPLVFLFWIVSSLSHTSGTIVVTAHKVKNE